MILFPLKIERQKNDQHCQTAYNIIYFYECGNDIVIQCVHGVIFRVLKNRVQTILLVHQIKDEVEYSKYVLNEIQLLCIANIMKAITLHYSGKS